MDDEVAFGEAGKNIDDDGGKSVVSA